MSSNESFSMSLFPSLEEVPIPVAESTPVPISESTWRDKCKIGYNNYFCQYYALYEPEDQVSWQLTVSLNWTQSCSIEQFIYFATEEAARAAILKANDPPGISKTLIAKKQLPKIDDSFPDSRKLAESMIKIHADSTSFYSIHGNNDCAFLQDNVFKERAKLARNNLAEALESFASSWIDHYEFHFTKPRRYPQEKPNKTGYYLVWTGEFWVPEKWIAEDNLWEGWVYNNCDLAYWLPMLPNPNYKPNAEKWKGK